MEETEHFLTS
jgi:hypothetical protein